MKQFLEKINHRLIAVCTTLLVLLLGSVSLSAQELPCYYKAKSEVNVRKEPNAKSAKVTMLRKYQSVLVTRITKDPDNQDWGYCSIVNDNEGWVCMKYMYFDRPGPEPSTKQEMKQWKKVLLHTAHFFGYEQKNVWRFYGYLLVILVMLFSAYTFGEEHPFLALLFHTIAFLATYGYFYFGKGELLWHATWDSVRWWSIIGVSMYVYFAHVIWGYVKSFLRQLVGLIHQPIFSILSVIIGLGWLLALIWFAGRFFMEHSLWVLILLLGLKPESKQPTIYVEGEGYVTGHGYDGGSKFKGDNGNHYYYEGGSWYPM